MPDPDHPRRIRVVGTSGSGKSTLAAEISRHTGLPLLELDEVFWDAGWRYRDLDEALRQVDAFTAENARGWVIEGNWTSRLDGRLDPGTDAGAEVVVWLDHPRALVMGRVIRRTLRRGILREELWHGNRERPSTWFARDPRENIVLWAWTNHARVRDRMLAHSEDGWPIVRLRGRRAVREWLSALR